MRAHIATLLDVALDAASVKATRGEGLGPIGRAEGIAAQAIVLLVPA
jgi:2C-methyl-D-erythritol 2,4-cyclodiphosphate synthase